MEALSIYCRNKHWSQCFNWILISSAGSPSVCLATVVLAVLDSRAASTTVAGQTEGQPADEIKIRLKHCDQYLFLQYMLNCWVPPYPNQFLIFGLEFLISTPSSLALYYITKWWYYNIMRFFFSLTAPRCPGMAAGAVSLKKSHDTVILSFCNIVKGQAIYLCSTTAHHVL